MAINDPRPIKFNNEGVRVIAERAFRFYEDLHTLRQAYDGGLGSFFFGHEQESIDDGREAEGISRMTGGDVTALVAFLLYTIHDAFEAPGVAAIIQKPRVNLL